MTENIHILKNWKILVTGITSIHGWPIFSKLQELLPSDNLVGIRPPRSLYPQAENVVSSCITNRDKLKYIKESFQPTHIIHCAGICDLDLCEGHPEIAHSLNVMGTKNIVEIFSHHTTIIYMSTDLVFSGVNTPEKGYSEYDKPDPINVVGKTFSNAEELIKKCQNFCIIRLSLPLGDSIQGNKGAIDWIENRFKRNLPVTLFHNEYRTCIRCEDIGNTILYILCLKFTGLFHLGGSRVWSLYDIGIYVLNKGNYPASLLKGIMRHEEIDGPPRIGDVSLNSNKIMQLLKP